MTQPPFDNNTNTNDDEIFADVEAEAAAMAAAMGFSSFGQQAPAPDFEPDDNSAAGGASDRPSKKRRYNSRVDAYVGPTPQGTGANDVPVQRRVFAPAAGSVRAEVGDRLKDENEINLDDNLDLDLDDDEKDPAAGASTTTTTTLPINPSLPPKPQIQVSNQQPGFNNNPNNQRGGQGHGGRGGSRGGRGGHNHGGGGTHGRDPTKPWYTDYYDPSSNENPWERLEQQRGMEAVGSWLPSRSGGGGGGGGRGGFGAGALGSSGRQEEDGGQPGV